MTSILCLAHYCDVHGPTPLMVTEGLPVPCSMCYETELADYSASKSASTLSAQAATAISDALRQISLNRSSSMPASEWDSQTHRASLLRSVSHTAAPPSSAAESPPGSPHAGPNAQQRGGSGRESSFRRTYDTRRANPCENCAMTLPRRQEGGAGASSDGSRAGGPTTKGPTLRTRAPYARVYGSGETSSSRSSQTTSSNTSVSSDTDDTDHTHPDAKQARQAGLGADEVGGAARTGAPFGHRRTGTITSTTSRSSASSSAAASRRGGGGGGAAGGSGSGGRSSHTHYINYTSTHEPGELSFKILRNSCLRTLSFETPARSLATAPPLSGYQGATPPLFAAATAGAGGGGGGAMGSTPLPSPTSFVTTHSAGAAASGGPMFFGDPAAGYTTAYIFRISDVHARGHKRVYALMSLSTHRERQTMKTFGYLGNAFRELAAWIQELAEAEAERAASESGGGTSPVVMNPPTNFLSGGGGFDSSSGNIGAALHRPATAGGSSFLAAAGSGLSRRMGSGFGGSVSAPRARGLPELVGMPDFFIELHSRFVRMLLELSVVMNS